MEIPKRRLGVLRFAWMVKSAKHYFLLILAWQSKSSDLDRRKVIVQIHRAIIVEQENAVILEQEVISRILHDEVYAIVDSLFFILSINKSADGVDGVLAGAYLPAVISDFLASAFEHIARADIRKSVIFFSIIIRPLNLSAGAVCRSLPHASALPAVRQQTEDPPASRRIGV